MPTLPTAVPERATEDRAQPTWREAAACHGDSAQHFYPPPHVERRDERREREARARALCRGCAVQPQCLSYALVVQEPHGIWGGLNELQRRRLLRAGAVQLAG